MRQISSNVQLYTEMIAGEAVAYSEKLDSFLGHEQCEEPLALQIGTANPSVAGEAVSRAQAFGGFNEFNLNCGCP